MSIRDNIAYGRAQEDHISDERIEAAARAANAHDFITRLPEVCIKAPPGIPVKKGEGGGESADMGAAQYCACGMPLAWPHVVLSACLWCAPHAVPVVHPGLQHAGGGEGQPPERGAAPEAGDCACHPQGRPHSHPRRGEGQPIAIYTRLLWDSGYPVESRWIWNVFYRECWVIALILMLEKQWQEV